jgi:hyperosmotically inducible protein
VRWRTDWLGGQLDHPISSRLLLRKGQIMKTKLATACFVLGTLLAPIIGYTDDMDMDRSHPKAYVKDSAITTKIKAKLAKEHMASAMHIKVDTDNNGVVWLSGTAKTQEDIDKAVSIASDTKGVKSVKNHIKIK